MNSKGQINIILAILIVLLLGIIGLLVYQNLQLRQLAENKITNQTEIKEESTETPLPQETMSPPIPSPTPNPTTKIPTGWLIYKNEKYGFQIAYPSSYKALTDKNNLYGWPSAVVLIYSGGQSYDLPIEVWDSQSEYQSKYKNEPNLVVKKINGKFITLLNTNGTAEVEEIINTFSPISE